LADDVSEEQKKARFLELEARHRSLQKGIHKSYVGRQVSVLVEGESTRSAEDLTGHSSCHKVVNFYGGSAKPGDLVKVLITEAKSNSLYGVCVN
jgi:tRNA-2-methylthio-N6-dimethylallyladenosine synthase